MKPDQSNPGFRSVEPIRDPFPMASFGSLGRFVSVECEPRAPSKHPRLTIPYSPEELGWIDPASLRVFEADLERGEFRLVFRSMPDAERPEVHAFIERSGIYGLIGLPRDEALLRAIRALYELIPPLGNVDGIEVGDLLGMVCGRILCIPPEEGGPRDDLVPPGGVDGDACQFCLGLNIPSNGLPEFQLLPLPPHRRPWGKVPPSPPSPAGPYLYALLRHYGASPDTVVEVVDLSTMTYVQTVQVGAFGAGHGMAVTPNGLCVPDWDGGNVVIVDRMGGKRTVPVGQAADDCVASLDGSTLYVSVRGSIVVLDVAAGQVVRTVPAIGPEYFKLLSLSPDGRTLAAGTTYSSFVYLFDTATHTARRVLITDPNLPTYPDAVSFTDSALVVVWDAASDRMYAIDVATATQLPGVMNNIANDSSANSLRPSYSAAKDRAYVTQGPWWLGNIEMESDLVVVDVPTLMGSVRGKFAGLWHPICLNPRDGKTLYIGAQGVDVDHPGMRRIAIDAYDTQADSFAHGVYVFRNQHSGGSDFSIRDFKITG
jgi:hypothetical protein